jgi:feruloyl esterase
MVSAHARTGLGAGDCENLSRLKLPDTQITSAVSVPQGGPVSVRGANGNNQQIPDLPAFCRVAATLTPSADSEIKVEVWLPATTWNGKFEAVGNGGWAGSIVYAALV